MTEQNPTPETPQEQPQTPAPEQSAPAEQPVTEQAAPQPAAPAEQAAPEQPAGEQPAAAPAAAAPEQAAPAPAPAAEQARQPQRGRGRDGRGGGRDRRDRRPREEEGGLESAVVRIYRCSKVVKGGRTFSFGALVIAGDRQGNVGIGYGKANEVPPAVEKATKDARKNLVKVNLRGSTIPHQVTGRAGASTVVLAPARPGTGVTAGKSVRPVLELAGITDILTKAYGSTSPKNLVKAALNALRGLQSPEEVAGFRGVELTEGAGEVATA